MRAKYYYTILVYTLLIIVLTGCIDTHLHIKVNRDGSGTYEFQIVSNRWVLAHFDDMKKQLANKGYTITPIDLGGNKSGWKAVKEVSNVAREMPMEEFQWGINSANRLFQSQVATNNPNTFYLAEKSQTQLKENPFQIDHGFFFTTLKLDTHVDLTDNQMEEFLGLSQLIYDGIDIRFILTLPIKASEHNATEVSPDGKTLTWVIKPGEKNPIHVSLKLPNLITWGVFIIGGLFFLILFILLYFKNKKKPRPPAGSPSQNGSISPASDSFRWG